MTTPRSVYVTWALIALIPLQAHGACREKLAGVDEQMASVKLDGNTRNALRQFRDEAASLCERGHEATAMQTLGLIGMMLTQAESEQTARPKSGSPVKETVPATRPEPEPVNPVASPNFPNRWDRLSQVDYCQWLSAEELARELTLSAPLHCRDTGRGFRYELPQKGNDWPVAFMLMVEVHPGQESVRKAEANVSEGFSKYLFTPFDAGTPELNVYVSTKGHYLYAFPAGGLTLWRLEYIKNSPERDKYYSPTPGRSGNADLGPRFMEILVDKYNSRL